MDTATNVDDNPVSDFRVMDQFPTFKVKVSFLQNFGQSCPAVRGSCMPLLLLRKPPKQSAENKKMLVCVTVLCGGLSCW